MAYSDAQKEFIKWQLPLTQTSPGERIKYMEEFFKTFYSGKKKSFYVCHMAKNMVGGEFLNKSGFVKFFNKLLKEELKANPNDQDLLDYLEEMQIPNKITNEEEALLFAEYSYYKVFEIIN